MKKTAMDGSDAKKANFRKSVTIATSLALSAWPVTASADTQFPAIGGSGDAQVVDRCPANMWLIGVKGRAGAWVDQVQIICAPIKEGGTQGAFWYGPVRGGGGAPQEFSCVSDSVVYAFQVYQTSYARQVKYFDVKCGSMRADRQMGFRFNQANANLGPTYGQGPTLTSCPEGELADGFAINFGKHVNAMGLHCRRR